MRQFFYGCLSVEKNGYICYYNNGTITGRIFMRRLKGFTLTELMVALAVIGILVAVVTPTIMKTRPNKNKMMIKKTFYTTEQIVATLINDARLYPDLREACDSDWLANNTETDDMYCAWGFDYNNAVRYEGETYEGDTKFAGLFKSRLNVKSGDDTVFYTTDGVKWDLSGTTTGGRSGYGAWTPGMLDGPEDAGVGQILIDVNGDDPPNARQSASSEDDFDQYVIEVMASGKLKISESDTKAIEYVTINTSIRDAL